MTRPCILLLDVASPLAFGPDPVCVCVQAAAKEEDEEGEDDDGTPHDGGSQFILKGGLR